MSTDHAARRAGTMPPLVVITGETASGKTALAIELAKRFNGEIVSADSRAIYKGMDIGTAKPDAEEQAGIPHHLIDVTTIDRPITAAEYKDLALEAIRDIAGRGKLPMLVGGTGLYIDSIIYDYGFSGGPGDTAQRRQWEKMPVEQLQALLAERGIPLPANQRNPRHLVRRLETGGQGGGKSVLRPNTLLIQVSRGYDETRERIALRTDVMFRAGLLAEAKKLYDAYGGGGVFGQTICYQELVPYFRGECSLADAQKNITVHTQQYAKRQRTWFRSYTEAHHLSKIDEAVDLLTTWLNNRQ